MGGGTRSAWLRRSRFPGLSPRGRGNLPLCLAPPGGRRSIPAWAGEPLRIYERLSADEVYPRVGGGTAQCAASRPTTGGLSPRGRGNQGYTARRPRCTRSIPAWAGEPGPSMVRWGHPTVYPRVGGGTDCALTPLPLVPGLSPRGRGNHIALSCVEAVYRSIPAWAGEPRRPPAGCPSAPVYPRVGGGTGAADTAQSGNGGLSPRGRGNPGRRPGAGNRKGSIPAWAGEPITPGSRQAFSLVYPRVGGGTPPGRVAGG